MMKSICYMILAVCMATGCASRNTGSAPVQQLQEGPVRLHESSTKVLLDNQNVTLKLIWQPPKGIARPVQDYPTATVLKNLIGKENEFVRVLVPDTQFSIFVSRTTSGVMIWDKKRSELWQAGGFPFRMTKNKFWYFKPVNRKITIFFGDDCYGYKWHFDFSEGKQGLKFDFDMWSGW